MITTQEHSRNDGDSELVLSGTETDLREFFSRGNTVLESSELTKAGGSVSMNVNGQLIRIIISDRVIRGSSIKNIWHGNYGRLVPSKDVLIATIIMLMCIFLVGRAILMKGE